MITLDNLEAARDVWLKRHPDNRIPFDICVAMHKLANLNPGPGHRIKARARRIRNRLIRRIARGERIDYVWTP
jgi:hypothetical protein